MKIALYESAIYWQNKEKNIEKLEKLLPKMQEELIDVLLLPEMSFTGFATTPLGLDEHNQETVTKMEILAAKYNIYLGFGWIQSAKKQGEKCENHYSVVSPKLGHIMDYAKIHPFSFSGEDQHYQGGKKIVCKPVLDFDIGLSICYDLRFPELYQKIAKKANLILVPACWPEKRINHYKALLIARAIETQSYVAGINCYGEIFGINYSGGTTLINPNGEELSPLKKLEHPVDEDENVFIYEIFQDTNRYRESFPIRKDRREDLYPNL